jgi:hypothetical protein
MSQCPPSITTIIVPLLGIYPKGCNTGYSKGTIAELQKQPRCPTTDKWIKKVWYLYTMEFYSAIKKYEILSFASKLMELENIILSKISQTQKTKKIICSPSYTAVFRSKANTAML